MPAGGPSGIRLTDREALLPAQPCAVQCGNNLRNLVRENALAPHTGPKAFVIAFATANGANETQDFFHLLGVGPIQLGTT